MSVANASKQAAQEISDAISSSLTEDEQAKVSKIVERALLEAIGEAVKGCKSAAVVCCGPEADLAHKIAEKIELKRTA